jgi:hypothetical protein
MLLVRSSIGTIILKWSGRVCGPNSADSGLDSEAGSCEDCNEPLGYTKDMELLEYLSDHQLLKPWT